MCSCHSILECCVTFSGVKLSIRSFDLFLSLIDSKNLTLFQRFFRHACLSIDSGSGHAG